MPGRGAIGRLGGMTYVPPRPVPPRPVPPRPVSTTGPAWMTWIGVVLLIGATVIAVWTVFLFVSLLPVGVLNADGSPGDRVIASGEEESTIEVDLDARTQYALLLVRPEGPRDAHLSRNVMVTAPDGSTFPSNRIPGFTVHVSGGGKEGDTVTAFRTSEAGRYTLDLPSGVGTEPGSLFLVEDTQPLAFVGGVFGSIGGVFAAILLGIIGLGLTIGGAVWWRSRRKARAAALSPAAPTTPPPPAPPTSPTTPAK